MVDSPCNDICTTDLESELCIGCGRTKDEISNWLIYSDEQKKSVLQDLKRRNNIDTRERYMLNNITMDNWILPKEVDIIKTSEKLLTQVWGAKPFKIILHEKILKKCKIFKRNRIFILTSEPKLV